MLYQLAVFIHIFIPSIYFALGLQAETSY